MAVRDEAKLDWEKGVKYKDIALKYGVSESTIKSWASRYWKNDKVATKKQKKSQPKDKKSRNHVGAPKGNKNAVGNKGGAPFGNTNSLKHGGYSIPNWDFIDDDEKKFISEVVTDEENLLIEQIYLFSIRERRIMQAINKYRNKADEPDTIDYSIRTENKRTFADDEEKALFEEKQQERIDKGEILPGKAYTIQTSTTNKDNIIVRLESELTSVQSKKTKAIDSLIKLRLENQKLSGDSKGNEAARLWVEKVTAIRRGNNE